jgi:hypothetical protein
VRIELDKSSKCEAKASKAQDKACVEMEDILVDWVT